MPTLKPKRLLSESYAFPGFRPQPAVRGVFGDPKARVITLNRRAKKQSAAPAARSMRAGTTDGDGGCAISRAATHAFISNSRYGAFIAGIAAR